MASKKKGKKTADVEAPATQPDAAPAQEQPQEVRESTGAKVTISETGIYRIGDVEFGVDRDSVINTRQIVVKLPRPTLESIITLHGDTVEADTETGTIAKQAASLVQNDWYQLIKGDVPMSVVKNHEKRTKEFKAKKKIERSNAERKERKLMQFRAGAKLNPEKMKGQAAVVAAILEKQGDTNVKRLAEAVEKSGKLVSKKQDALAVTRFYVSQFKSQGLIVGA